MKIQQFEDKNLAHYSYAILSQGKVMLIDPARNPKPYYDFANEHEAQIVGVIETHPHADFVSSHKEIMNYTRATIYVSELLGANYPHTTFDEGQVIEMGSVKFKALNTPGHSADSITIVLEDENGKDTALFTGDTLFIGDCGRPDLRESVGNIQQKREEQAGQMYHSLKKFLNFADDVLVYPAHGAGSLCGKGLSSDSSSTMGREKAENWSLQPMDEAQFVKALTEGQPFIPKYFGYDVELNRNGADAYQPSIDIVLTREPITCEGCAKELNPNIIVVDARKEADFKAGHLGNSINIQDATQFETWLGSIINPGEKFYLAAQNEEQLKDLIARIAKIGYEPFIERGFVLDYSTITENRIDLKRFMDNMDDYTIVDIRSEEEAKEKLFKNSINIPLHQLRERVGEIPYGGPIVIHCAGGYRSAAGASIVKGTMGTAEVYDLSEAVKQFEPILMN